MYLYKSLGEVMSMTRLVCGFTISTVYTSSLGDLVLMLCFHLTYCN